MTAPALFWMEDIAKNLAFSSCGQSRVALGGIKSRMTDYGRNLEFFHYLITKHVVYEPVKNGEKHVQYSYLEETVWGNLKRSGPLRRNSH